MATIQATLRKKKNKAGLYPLAIRITKNRKSTYLYTGQYVEDKFWDATMQKVKKSHPNSTRLNNLIATKLAEANNSVLEAETKPKNAPQVFDIKANITKKHKSSSFYIFAKEYFNQLEKNKKFSRINSERPLLNRIKTYHSQKDLDFTSLTPKFLNGFITHLRTLGTVGERSIVNNLIFIRTLFNAAINQNLVSSDLYPFGKEKGKIRIKIPDSIKIGLTIEEIQAIENLNLKSNIGQNHTKNIFLFSFYLAGMRVADILKMRWSSVQDGRLYYRMNKNQKPLSLKIHDKLQSILNQYEQHKTSNNDFIFPELNKANLKDLEDVLRKTKTSTKKFNRYLGQIAKKASIEKKVTMHIARHSFGNISGDKIPLKTLQRLYNHSNIQTTMQYQQNFINKDMDDALDKVMGF